MSKYVVSALALALASALSFPLRAQEHAAQHDHGHAPAAALSETPTSKAVPARMSGDHQMAANEHQHGAASMLDRDAALKVSQEAIGRTLGEYVLRDRAGKDIRLADYRGKPVVISMIYTSCAHVCPVITRHLLDVVGKAQQAFGENSFSVVTVGFDTARDNPSTMAEFAKAQGVHIPNWKFLSADDATITRLARDLGFLYFPSAAGFDHMAQATLVDAGGKIYRQVYGETFDTPLMIEPLKEMISGVESQHPGLAGISNRIRLFCTVYDPITDSYRTDYSFFLEIGMGLLIVGGIGWYLVRESRRRKFA